MKHAKHVLALALAGICLLSGCIARPIEQKRIEEKQIVTFPEPEVKEEPEAVIVEETPEQETVDERFARIAESTSYVDPAGRFTVTLPDIFTETPDEAQPEDGIYMQNADGSAYFSVTVSATTSTAEDYAAMLEKDYGVLPITRPDGLVCWSDRFTDGFNDPWAQFFYVGLLDDCTVRVEYVFRQEVLDLCKPGCDLITID